MIKVALCGNPNCGKTTLFNNLTGSQAHVGNWPGVTVERKEGLYKRKKDFPEEIYGGDDSDGSTDVSDIGYPEIGADGTSDQGPCSYAHIVDTGVDGHCYRCTLRGILYDFRLEGQIIEIDCESPQYTQQHGAHRME